MGDGAGEGLEEARWVGWGVGTSGISAGGAAGGSFQSKSCSEP